MNLDLRALLLCVALASVASLASTQSPSKQNVATKPPQNDALRQELLRMEEADQAVRARWTNDVSNAEIGREMNALDEKNTVRLEEIVRRYGFPDTKLVGRDGLQAAHTLVSHSPSIAFQKRSLAYFKKLYRRGEVPPDAVANLADIILHSEGKPQLYGTRFDIVGGKLVLQNVKDPKRLEERRRKLGLMPLGDYIKFLEELYKMPVDMTTIPH